MLLNGGIVRGITKKIGKYLNLLKNGTIIPQLSFLLSLLFNHLFPILDKKSKCLTNEK